jgi:Tfp pilus assembly protein PilF
MTEQESTEVISTPRRQPRVDLVLRVALVVLVLAVLGVGSYLGYAVYITTHADSGASPAMRIIQQLEAAAKKNPRSADMWVRLGEAQGSAGLYDDASASLRNAVKIDPKHSGAYLDLGLVAMAKKDPGTAESAFKKVISLEQSGDYSTMNQRLEQAYFYLGTIAVDAKRYDDGVAYLKAALRIRRDSSDTYYYLALAYHGLQDDSTAQKNLDAALTFDPKYPDANLLQGEIYKRASKEPSAAVAFRVALTGAPQSPDAQKAIAALGPADPHVTAGAKALAANKLPVALSEAIIAKSIDPENLSALLLYARVEERRGDKADALDAYKQAQSLSPNDADIRAAIKRLSK